LEGLVGILRPMHLRSLEGLETNARGRLITTLLRVSRQPKPSAPASPESTPTPEPAQDAAPEATPEEAAPAVAAAEGSESEPAAPAVGATEPPAPEASPPQAPKAEPVETLADVLFQVARVWRAAGDGERAASAFQASGREPEAEPEIVVEQKA